MAIMSGFRILLSSKSRSLATTTVAKSWWSTSYSSSAAVVSDESFESDTHLKDYADYRRSLYGQITHKALLVDVVGTLVLPSQPMAQIYRQIRENFGVEYSEEEILHRYRRAYSQPWVKSHLRKKLEFGEIEEKKKVNSEVPWIPTTPFKPIARRPVQICTSRERNQLNSQFNGEFASLESSAGGDVTNRSESVAGTSNIGHDNARARVQVSFDNVSGLSNSFAELLAQVGAASAYCNSRYDFLENQFVHGVWNSQFDQSCALLGNHNLYQ